MGRVQKQRVHLISSACMVSDMEIRDKIDKIADYIRYEWRGSWSPRLSINHEDSAVHRSCWACCLRQEKIRWVSASVITNHFVSVDRIDEC